MTSAVGVIERPSGLVCEESAAPNGLPLKSRSLHIQTGPPSANLI
jgi:hypothetical protein